jgi:hypothetical protein
MIQEANAKEFAMGSNLHPIQGPKGAAAVWGIVKSKDLHRGIAQIPDQAIGDYSDRGRLVMEPEDGFHITLLQF